MKTFDDLKTKYPRLIDSKSCFQCNTGWLTLLDEYFSRVDNILPSHIKWNNRQIKEKFGTLRLYCEPIMNNDYDSELIEKLVQIKYEIEGRSAHICEECGEPGTLVSSDGWVYTACKKHSER